MLLNIDKHTGHEDGHPRASQSADFGASIIGGRTKIESKQVDLAPFFVLPEL